MLVGKDLSAAGTQTANCYVVNTTDANKWYRFKATIRGNGAATSAQISYTGTDIPANDMEEDNKMLDALKMTPPKNALTKLEIST